RGSVGGCAGSRSAAVLGAADSGGGTVSGVEDLTAAEVAAKLAAGELSSAEATQASLDRIAATDEAYHAFLHVDRDGALATGRRIDGRRCAGAQLSARDCGPIAVKDVLSTKGLPTSCGSTIFEGWIPPYAATVGANLRAA